jgi:hypothetical protein
MNDGVAYDLWPLASDKLRPIGIPRANRRLI